MKIPQRSQVLMDQNEIEAIILKFSHDIFNDYPDPDCLAIIGIQTGGAYLARRLTDLLNKKMKTPIGLGILDITLYRDDLALEKNQPVVRKTTIPFSLSDKIIILVDDVLYTGRTIRAALDAIIDFGRPKAIRLAVLIDRGLREFPIRPDYTGKSITTKPDQSVLVSLRENGNNIDQVLLQMGD